MTMFAIFFPGAEINIVPSSFNHPAVRHGYLCAQLKNVCHTWDFYFCDCVSQNLDAFVSTLFHKNGVLFPVQAMSNSPTWYANEHDFNF